MKCKVRPKNQKRKKALQILVYHNEKCRLYFIIKKCSFNYCFKGCHQEKPHESSSLMAFTKKNGLTAIIGGKNVRRFEEFQRICSILYTALFKFL